MDLKTKLFFLKAKDYQKLLFRRILLYIVFSTTLFWVGYLEKIANGLIKFIVAILSQIGWYLYFALTPFWITTKTMGLVISWVQAVGVIIAVHTIVYVYRLPRWLFWTLIAFFFLAVFIFNIFVLNLRVDGP